MSSPFFALESTGSTNANQFASFTGAHVRYSFMFDLSAFLQRRAAYILRMRNLSLTSFLFY